MPQAIPLVAAAFSVSAGLTAGGIMGGLMVAGGALTGLGALTGNKKLARIGAIASLAGGVGSALGELGTAASGAGAGGALQTGANATAGNTIADAIGGGTAAGDLAGAVASGAAPAAEAVAGEVGKGILESAGSGGSVFGSVLDTNPFMGGAAASATPSLASPMNAVSGLGNTAGTFGQAAAEPAGLLARAGDFAKGVGGWIEKNPQSAKLVSGLIEGAASPYLNKLKLKDQLEMEQRYANWVRQKYSDSVRNLQIPSIFAPVPSAGIISGQRG